jgi:hypothetical protein
MGEAKEPGGETWSAQAGSGKRRGRELMRFMSEKE